MIGLRIPAFSNRALKALASQLAANGEVLPLISTIGSYAAFNVTTVLTAVDHDRSEIIWSVDAAWALDIERFEFIPEELVGATIFKPRELPNAILVTDSFVEAAKRARLRGMGFRKLWPLAIGERWTRQKPDELRGTSSS